MQTITKISAIVPAYNVRNYVVSAIDSLLNQTEKFHEIIIVDDGSTDGTGMIVDQYQGVAGVRVLHTKNAGQGRARNLGLSQASGNYVYFFDADDFLAPDFVESMHALIDIKPDTDIIYFSGASFLDAGCTSDYMPSYDRTVDMEYPSGIDATGLMLQQNIYFSSPCLYLSKRTLWRDNQLAFINIVHEDEEIIMRLSCTAGGSICLSKVFFHRRIRTASMMTQPKSRLNAIGYLRTMESIASYCQRNRAKVAPILHDLVRRFYSILCGYFALCKTVEMQPEYRKIFVLLVKIGRFPSLRQMAEMWLPATLHARLSTVKHRWIGRMG